MTLIALAIAWVLAIAMVATWAAPWWLPAVSIAALIPVAMRGWIPVGAMLMTAMVAAAGIGALRFATWDERPPPGLVAMTGQEVSLRGVVASLPDPGRTVQRYRIDVDAIDDGGRLQPMDGAVLVTVSQYADYEPGDIVSVRGELEEAPELGDFDYRAFLLRRGIAGTMFYPRIEVSGETGVGIEGLVAPVRTRLEAALNRALPEPEASLAAGIAIGWDGGIDPERYESYRRTGLAHILAVSGSNVAILTGMVFLVLVPLVGRNAAVAPAAFTIAGYVLLAGAEASIVRAGIMAAIFLGGMWLGRQEASLAALGAAVIGMTAVTPGAAREVGFQLSVAATAGLIVFGPWIRAGLAIGAQRVGAGGILPRPVEQVIAISLAATVATLPLTWVNFRAVSLVGPLANVLVEPLFVFAFVLGLVTAAAGAVWEPAGWAVGLVAYYPLAACSWIAETLSGVPGASVSLPRMHAGWAFASYVMLGGLGWLAFRYRAPVDERPPIAPKVLEARRAVLGAGAAIVAVVGAWHALEPIGGPGELELAMLDVGQGDALLVTTPSGGRVLVDGGPSGIETVRELGDVMAHWERGIDAVVLTHPQQDHIGGLPEVLERYDVAAVYDSGARNTTEAFAVYEGAAGNRQQIAAGDSFDIDGVRFEVMWPPADYGGGGLNNRSVVLRIGYGETAFLLTGDIEEEPQLHLMVADAVATTVLKVPHHGSATSVSAFFDAASPALALISVGADNRFGHPAEETLEALGGVVVYRTDVHGRVVVRTDGERIEVRTERD